MKKFKEWFAIVLINSACIIFILLMLCAVVLSIANKLGFRFVIRL